MTPPERPPAAPSTTPRRGVRAVNRERIEADILRLGRVQLAEVGAAALSVRAIARELQMASSAVYRYVASRDELLTRLIVESYDSLADAADGAQSAAPRDDLRGRWFALGHGVRDWALAHPHDWALLFGSPVPGYDAPAERTNTAGTRVTTLALQILLDIVAAGRAPMPSARAPWPPAASDSAELLLAGLGIDESALPVDLFVAGLTAWTLLTGAVNSEVFEYQGPIPGDPVGLFDAALEAGLRLILA